MQRTEIVFIFPETRAYSRSNRMHDIFLILTQATQFEFKKVLIFCKPFMFICLSVLSVKQTILPLKSNFREGFYNGLVSLNQLNLL